VHLGAGGGLLECFYGAGRRHEIRISGSKIYDIHTSREQIPLFLGNAGEQVLRKIV
jgi:hypothetical protein